MQRELFGRPVASSEEVNHSEQEHGRALLTPDEILRLPYEDALLFVGGMAPYLARKVMYYADLRFNGRTDRPTPDSERQRRGELLRTREPSDWEQLPLPVPPALAQPVPPGRRGLAPSGLLTASWLLGPPWRFRMRNQDRTTS